MNENSPGEAGSIEKIPSALRSHLRAGVAISSFTQCIEELVYNAIDAKASCIAVRVDLELLKVEVIDNGNGINPSDMKKIGGRYMTSKCKQISDIEEGCLEFHGYRGEAIASIRQISSILQIISRASTNEKTYVAVFVRGKQKAVEEASSQRSVCGTTVIVGDFFYNLPIRRKALNLALELEDVKNALIAIALSHPHVSLTLRDESSGEKLVQSARTTSFKEAFLKLHTSDNFEWDDSNLLEISATHKAIKLRGFISSLSHTNNSKQFVFVNKRWVKRSRLLKIICRALKDSAIVRSKKQKMYDGPLLMNDGSSPLQSRLQRYPCFLIFIECPLKEIDITFEPRKTEIEFEDWSGVSTFIHDAISDFLGQNHLVVPKAYATEKETVQVTENSVNDYMPNITGVQPISEVPSFSQVEIKKTLSTGNWHGSRHGMRATKKNRNIVKESSEKIVIESDQSFRNDLRSRKFTGEGSLLPRFLHDLKEKCGPSSERLRRLSLVTATLSAPSAGKSRSSEENTINEHMVSAQKINEAASYSTSSSDFHGSNITGNISCGSTMGDKQFGLELISPKPSYQVCESISSPSTYDLGVQAARKFLMQMHEPSLPNFDFAEPALPNRLDYPIMIPESCHKAVFEPVASEEQSQNIAHSTSCDLDCIEADAIGNQSNHDATLNVISSALKDAQEAFAASQKTKAPTFPLTGSAKRALNFNQGEGRTLAERTPEETFPQSSSKKRKTKKLWPLPSGTTPYIEKSKRAKVSAKKAENTRISSCLPIDWVNPILLMEGTSFMDESSYFEKSCRNNPLFANSWQLDKSQIPMMTLIGQVDLKFICVSLTEATTQSKMLLMLDQHAVHERIRLEALMAENFTDQSTVHISYLEEPILLDVNSTEKRILRTYRKKCHKLGLILNHTHLGEENDDVQIDETIFAVGVPACFLRREASEKHFNRASSLSLLTNDLAKELAQSLLTTKGGMFTLPKTIRNVLNSQACRSAIMFGDKLTKEECSTFLQELSTCEAPFQCAHGRPSVAPLVDLSKLSRNDGKTKISFYSLHQCMN